MSLSDVNLPSDDISNTDEHDQKLFELSSVPESDHDICPEPPSSPFDYAFCVSPLSVSSNSSHSDSEPSVNDSNNQSLLDLSYLNENSSIRSENGAHEFDLPEHGSSNVSNTDHRESDLGTINDQEISPSFIHSQSQFNEPSLLDIDSSVSVLENSVDRSLTPLDSLSSLPPLHDSSFPQSSPHYDDSPFLPTQHSPERLSLPPPSPLSSVSDSSNIPIGVENYSPSYSDIPDPVTNIITDTENSSLSVQPKHALLHTPFYSFSPKAGSCFSSTLPNSPHISPVCPTESSLPQSPQFSSVASYSTSILRNDTNLVVHESNDSDYSNTVNETKVEPQEDSLDLPDPTYSNTVNETKLEPQEEYLDLPDPTSSNTVNESKVEPQEEYLDLPDPSHSNTVNESKVEPQEDLTNSNTGNKRKVEPEEEFIDLPDLTQPSESSGSAKETTTNEDVNNFVDLTCDDDDDVEIVAVDQPVVFLGSESHSRTRSRKRRRIDNSSSCDQEPIVIHDDVSLPTQSDGLIEIRDSPELPVSTNLSVSEVNPVNSNLSSAINIRNSQEPKFFGDFLNQSIIPIEQDGYTPDNLSTTTPLASRSPDSIAGPSSTGLSIHPTQEGRRYPVSESVPHVTVSRVSLPPRTNQERNLTDEGARQEGRRSQSVIDDPIPSDVLSDISAMYAEDEFVRQLMTTENNFASSSRIRSSASVPRTRTSSRPVGPIPNLYSGVFHPPANPETSVSNPIDLRTSNSAFEPRSSGLSSSSFLRSIASFFSGSSAPSSSENSHSMPSSSSVDVSTRTLRSMSGSSLPSSESWPAGKEYAGYSSRSTSSLNICPVPTQSGDDSRFSCPICFESFQDIKKDGKTISSTNCGHIFCTPCLEASFRQAKHCPTCRKKLSKKQYHPLYI